MQRPEGRYCRGWLRGVCGLAGQSVRLEDVPARGLVGSVAALHRDRAERCMGLETWRGHPGIACSWPLRVVRMVSERKNANIFLCFSGMLVG